LVSAPVGVSALRLTSGAGQKQAEADSDGPPLLLTQANASKGKANNSSDTKGRKLKRYIALLLIVCSPFFNKWENNWKLL
jgi:hypothetical protein